MDNLLYSLESVVPLFVLILTGYILRRRHILNEPFIQVGTALGFKLALPVLLFQQISNADFTQAFNPKLILFSLSATLTSIFLLCLLIPRFVKENAQRGAMIQGIYRGNFAILGVPLAINMFGEAGAAPTSLLLPFTIPLYNALAVIILTVFSPERDIKHKISFKTLIKDIITNPLIIGIVLGLPFSIFHWQLPALVTKSLSQIASLTTPLSLICLGGQFTFHAARKNFALSVWATVIKLLIIPSITLTLAALLGFRNGELGAIFILFMAPSAVSGYIMAKNMHSDEQLAAQILIMTTFVSCFTLFGGILLLRTLHLLS
ncbi:MAG: AEC family transporter [Lachnospiraceae bacterium]|jgi:predicted permease|nr:AEC family transporter [Lachnospiraceae bacterium]